MTTKKRGQKIIDKKIKDKTKPLLQYVKNGKVDKALIRKYIKVSNRGNSKYSVRTPMGKLIHWGDKRFEQYSDQALGTYKHLDHNDVSRRASYRARHKKIFTKDKRPAYLNPEQPSFYSYWMLWS